MAAYSAADLRIQRKRHVKRINQLMAQIDDRRRTAAHLVVITVRGTYYFFTATCLVAALVTFVNDKRDAATVWGGIGITLLLLLLAEKGTWRALKWAFRELREELEEIRPGAEAEAEAQAEADAEAAAVATAEPTVRNGS